MFCSGIINSKGALWKEQRKFLHDKLRHFGMTYMGNGRQKMEKRIMVRLKFDFLKIKIFVPVVITFFLSV